jgi:hypothetical protein
LGAAAFFLAGAFLGAALIGVAALGLAATALAGAFLAGIVALAAPAFALATAGFPFFIGLPQQKTSATAQPHASSTNTTSSHTSQLSLSPFFTFAMLRPPLVVGVNATHPVYRLYTKTTNFQALLTGKQKNTFISSPK